jgi:hypothetical protein
MGDIEDLDRYRGTAKQKQSLLRRSSALLQQGIDRHAIFNGSSDFVQMRETEVLLGYGFMSGHFQGSQRDWW